MALSLVLFFSMVFHTCVSGYINPITLYDSGVIAGSSIEELNGTYYLVTDEDDAYLAIRTSTNLQLWSTPIPILLQNNMPPWLSQDHFHVPEFFISPGGKFYVYFDTNQGCIGVASAPRYTGPYTIEDKPLLCARDARPAYFKYPSTIYDNGSLILYYQETTLGKTKIAARKLGSDFISFATSEETEIIRPDEEWNSVNVMASRVFKRKAIYYLIFAVDYCKGLYLARSLTPLGPFIRQGNVKLNSTTTPLISPLHVDVIPDLDGNLSLFATDNKFTNGSCYFLQEELNGFTLSWTEDEWPYLVNEPARN